MALDIQKIDEQIKRLERLRQLASDPEMVRLMEAFVLNGAGANVVPTPSGPKSARDEDREQFTLNVAVKSDPADNGAEIRLTKDVWRAIQSGNRERFDLNAIAQKLRSDGRGLKNIAVGRTLHRFEKRGWIKLTERGYGNSPNYYRVLSDEEYAEALKNQSFRRFVGVE